MSPKPRKFRKGPPILNLMFLAEWCDKGGWVYLHHKVMHPSFLTSMPFRTVYRFVREYHINYAMPVDKDANA